MASADRLAEMAKLNRSIATIEIEIADVWFAAVDAGLTLAVPAIDGGRMIGLTG